MNDKIVDNFSLSLTLPKNLPESLHAAADRLNSAAPIAPNHQNNHDSSEGIYKILIKPILTTNV